MMKFWSNCKIGVKLQASFALVMLVFGAALVGMFAANAKVSALTVLQVSTLVPARSAVNKMMISGYAADDAGGYYLMERRPAQKAVYLADYRRELAAFRANLSLAERLAGNDTQRGLIAEIHKTTDGPQGWYQGNEDAFALIAAGNVTAAQSSYSASPPEFVSAVDNLRKSLVAESDASYVELARLQVLARTIGAILGVLAVVLGFAIATAMSRAISRSVGATTQAIGGIVSEDIGALGGRRECRGGR
jgi:hypothetical protein